MAERVLIPTEDSHQGSTSWKDALEELDLYDRLRSHDIIQNGPWSLIDESLKEGLDQWKNAPDGRISTPEVRLPDLSYEMCCKHLETKGEEELKQLFEEERMETEIGEVGEEESHDVDSQIQVVRRWMYQRGRLGRFHFRSLLRLEPFWIYGGSRSLQMPLGTQSKKVKTKKKVL